MEESKIFLDKEDVEAIAQEREFDVTPKTKMQRLVEWSTVIVALIFGILTIWAVGSQYPAKVIGVWAGVMIAATILNRAVCYWNSEPRRKAIQDFISHWQKTGEIKPRWPGRLRKNQDDSGRPPLGA